MWALASHMANDIDDITPPSSESPDTAMVPTPGHDFAPNSEGVVIASIPDNIRDPSSQASEPADNTYNKFNVTQRKNEREAEENLCHAHMGCYKIAPAVRTTCKSYQQRSGSTVLHDILNRLRHIVQRPHPHSRDHGCCGRSRTVHRHHTLHNFTGADWGGKCFGISKKSWITSYLSLPSNTLAKRCSQTISWWTVSCPKKCGPSRSLFVQYTALEVQLPHQLCVGNCSGSGIWRARSFLRQELH